MLCVSKKNRVEIHDFKDWKAGVYLIEAGCGMGKNYFVFNTLFAYAHENGKRMLVFSNRVALREQQQAQTPEKDIKLITYQSLEHDEYLGTMQGTKDKVRGLMQQVSEYDYIILDEAHYLYQDAPFNKNTETIIELVARYRTSKIIVLLSATPDLLKKYLQIDKAYFFKADYSYIKEVQYYTKRDTLDEIISRIPEDEKIVMFADSKDRLKELHSEYPNSAYLDASNKKRRKVFNQIEQIIFAADSVEITDKTGNNVNKYTLLPKDASDYGITWTSADESVAIVNDKGEVEAKSEGKTVIIATAENGVSAQYSVEVTPMSVWQQLTADEKSFVNDVVPAMYYFKNPESVRFTEVRGYSGSHVWSFEVSAQNGFGGNSFTKCLLAGGVIVEMDSVGSGNSYRADLITKAVHEKLGY